MIKYHPSKEFIRSYVNGDLPASLSIAITIHAEMCPKCNQEIAMLTKQTADRCFETVLDNSERGSDQEVDIDTMIQEITALQLEEQQAQSERRTVIYGQQSYQLPHALSRVDFGKASKVGKLTRSRAKLEEGEIRSSLLHIKPGGAVPEHTHKGYELTLLLDGSFSDKNDKYHKGDFILLDASDTHQPISKEGCLCFTVANDALHFTQGVNKLLNPIANFIY